MIVDWKVREYKVFFICELCDVEFTDCTTQKPYCTECNSRTYVVMHRVKI
jgi:hypothetical protein